MPTDSKRRTYKKKKPRKKAITKYRRSGYSQRLPRGLIPQKTFVNLPYAATVSFSPVSTGVLGNYTLRANSIYDPLQTGVGSSVKGITHMFEKYDHCTVVGAKLTVDFQVLENDGTFVVGVIPTDGGSISSTIASSDGFRIARRSFYKTIQNSSGEKKQMVRMVYNLGIAKFFGIRRSIVGDTRYIHSVSGNPTEQAYFQLMGGNADDADTTTPVTIRAFIRIDYGCVFTEPKEVILA